MSARFKLAIAVAFVGVLGACAQQEEPAPITFPPTVDKMGNATCPAGTVLAIDEATGAEVCAEAPAV